MTKQSALMTATLAVALSSGARAADPVVTFTRLWTHAHVTPGQVSEIPAFDKRTNTIWVAGVVGVDVLDAGTGVLLEHIDVTAHGLVNSVAIHNGLAALAVEAPSGPSDTVMGRRNPGVVLFYDTSTRTPSAGVNVVEVGALPDMLTFTHDGSRLLVANEGTPNAGADRLYNTPDPAGSVAIIDMETRTVVATAGFAGLPAEGGNLRTNTGMDFEPEYIAVSHDGTQAFVTVQEGNGIAVLDLTANEFTKIIGLGAKDFSVAGNEIDPKDNDGTVLFRSVAARGLYMPDGVAVYQWRGGTYAVLANEGDFREDNVDRSAASSFGAVAPLDRLRVSNVDSSAGTLFAAGARSISIRDADGTIVYDSGSLLDREAHARGIYDDGRSRDKGVEPEGVALLDMLGRTYAFVGLERTTKSAVAIFDVTDPNQVTFVDMIVTAGDLAPEGLAAYHDRGGFYLAIANEMAPAGGTSNTTLYRLNPTLPKP
ncbi:MAG TPA: choice-of-anchor I family protein [Vicinamibacterales bacterium]|nr:choice-of-anchor I family protein [Vicinamibacterales bacterium]